MANGLFSRFNPFVSPEEQAGAEQYIAESRLGELPALGETVGETAGFQPTAFGEGGTTMIDTSAPATQADLMQAGLTGDTASTVIGAGLVGTAGSTLVGRALDKQKSDVFNRMFRGEGGRFKPGMRPVTRLDVAKNLFGRTGLPRAVSALATRATPIAAGIAALEEAPRLFGDRSTSQIVTDAIVRDPETEAGAAQYAALGTDVAPLGPVIDAGVVSKEETPEPGSPQARFLAERAKGELSPEQIAQAQEFAASMGTTFDPEKGYSREPFLQSQVPAARGMGLRTDPQGRMIPAGFETRKEAFPEFEREAELREQRLETRPDFMEAQRTGQLRGQRRYTDAQLRDLFPDPDDRKAAKAMDAAGFDPVQKRSYADIEAGQAAQEAGFETEALRQQKMRLDIEELKKAGLPDDVEVVTDPSGLTLLYRNGQLFNAFRSQASQFTPEQMQSIIKGENPFSTVKPTPQKSITSEEYANLKKGDKFFYEGVEYTKQ
jgi:hypothetical protein